MSDVVAIVEGQTEQTFVRDYLAVHLGYQGVSIRAVLSGKTKKFGGVKKWAVTRRDILRELHAGRYCTTMFDFYGMPRDWPGRAEAQNQPPHLRGDYVENELLKDIEKEGSKKFDIGQFVPYVQVHEFEALLFTDVGVLAEQTASLAGEAVESLKRKFARIRSEVQTPEDINNSYETCPSQRISKLVRGYQKPLFGLRVTEAIGLEKMRKECKHFNQWYTKLELLGKPR